MEALMSDVSCEQNAAVESDVPSDTEELLHPHQENGQRIKCLGRPHGNHLVLVHSPTGNVICTLSWMQALTYWGEKL